MTALGGNSAGDFGGNSAGYVVSREGLNKYFAFPQGLNRLRKKAGSALRKKARAKARIDLGRFTAG